MRVALTKVDGVASVEVTLKRGVAQITLREGNTVTLAQLRRIVKDAGYTSQDAAVTALGRIVSRAGTRHLSVEGTAEVFLLEAHEAQPDVLRSAPAPNTRVEVVGIVTVPPSGTTTSERLRVQTITVRQ